MKKEASYQRHAQLFFAEKILVGKDLRNSLDQFFSKNGLSEEAKLSTLGEVRTIKLNFQTELAKALPTLPPTPHRVLKRLQYFCPKKFIESAETESAVMKVAKQIPIIGGNEEDDLRKEIRVLKDLPVETFGDKMKI